MTLLDQLAEIARLADREILQVYDSDFGIGVKEDNSPITEADRRAHDVISEGLEQLDPSIPILSEESKLASFEERKNWDRYWLVDPLDGTKDFVERNGEFTVNIALIEANEPVLGVISVPVRGTLYTGDVTNGSATLATGNRTQPISTKSLNPLAVTLVQSRHHAGVENEKIIRFLEQGGATVNCTAIGSSLKMCLVAQGKADLYVRFGPTSEWDLAAAHAILRAAGGDLCSLDGNPKQYNLTESLLNSSFYACGDSSDVWALHLKNAGCSPAQ